MDGSMRALRLHQPGGPEDAKLQGKNVDVDSELTVGTAPSHFCSSSATTTGTTS